MGLFSNNKKLCPICGNPTPRLFPTKIEGQPICKECNNEIDLPDGVIDNMTISDFKQYMVEFKENHALWPKFNTTYRYCFGFTSDSVILDENNGLFRLKNNGGGWVFEKKHLKSFKIYEDDNLLFESDSGTLNCYASDIIDRVQALIPSITQFYTLKREHERKMEMDRRLNQNKETDDERRERERISNMYRPRFEAPALFSGFRFEMTLDHPYWQSFGFTLNAPTFDDEYPDAEKYIKEYREMTDELHVFAAKLMQMIDPSAGETRIGTAAAQASPAAPAAAAAPVDAVAEIKKFKELLDQGIITDEEFAAKKRQLLGI